MRAIFTQSFRIQAVEKALSRSSQTSLREIAEGLGVGKSTLNNWIVKSRNHELDSVSADGMYGSQETVKERRPQDWSLEERLEMVIACDSLDELAMSELCRAKGIYAHHVKQWKLAFADGSASGSRARQDSESRSFKHGIKDLKKELRRKEKALAETAALLVLQKKSAQSGETTRTTHNEQRKNRNHFAGQRSLCLGRQTIRGL
jgi:transposase